MSKITVRMVKAIDYTMPLKRPYGTARGVSRGSRNFIAHIAGVALNGRQYEGLGECQPRHLLTGDGPRKGTMAWSFLLDALAKLRYREVDISTRETAVSGVRSLMKEMHTLATQHATSINEDKPFRGTLLGIEVALLDMVSRALGCQISDLLGRQRDEIAISISTISTSTGLDQLGEKVTKQLRYPITRVKGSGDVDKDVEIFKTIASANNRLGEEKPIWMDINEASTRQTAKAFIERLVPLMANNTLPRKVILEGMLPKADFLYLADLQVLADSLANKLDQKGEIDLRIMPDEGLWDAGDVAELNKRGGCRAINLKAPKAGGLLASIDLVEEALKANPDVHISVGGMLATSDLTAFTLHNLGRALPRLDYITATPPGNVAARITKPLARYIDKKSNIIAKQVHSGLGTQLDMEKLEPYITQTSNSIRQTGKESYTLVFGGDTSLGDKHHLAKKSGKSRQRLLEDPMYFLRGLKPLVANSDHLILNFESVLEVDPVSPLAEQKKYLGWDTPDRTLACFRELGVTAVGMANNHAMDFGADVMLKTLSRFQDAGIRVFGAGENLNSAETPLRLPLKFGEEVRNVYIFAGKAREKKLSEFGFFADKTSPGIASLNISRLANKIRKLKKSDPKSLIIVYPHWNFDYKWPTSKLRERGKALSDAGADFVIGHGTHILNDFSLEAGKGIAWSLGNFQFNWAGRYDSMPDAVPYSFVARLTLGVEEGNWKPELRLYPIRCDNRAINYQPRPVTEEEAESVVSILSVKLESVSHNAAFKANKDAIGWYIS